MKTLITKPKRLATAKAIAAVVSRVFHVAVPAVAHGDSIYNNDDCGSDRIYVETSAGMLGLTIEVSPRLLTVFAKFEGDMDDAKRATAKLVDGNRFSGKVNVHIAPNVKPSDVWLEQAVNMIELHLIKVRGRGNGAPLGMPTRSQLAARQRRIALGAERIADRESTKDAPWTDGNVRMWGGVMANAMRERNKILLAYLAERKARNA